MYKIMKHNLDIGKNSYLILKYKIKYNFGERRKINKDTRIYIYIYYLLNQLGHNSVNYKTANQELMLLIIDFDIYINEIQNVSYIL